MLGAITSSRPSMLPLRGMTMQADGGAAVLASLDILLHHAAVVVSPELSAEPSQG
jgi:hypothetical protein